MLKSSSSILELDNFSGIRVLSSGTALDSAKYSEITNDFEAATIVSNFNNNHIKTTNDSDFESGEAVLIKIGFFSFKNIINNAGTENNYILKDPIIDQNGDVAESGACEIKRLAKRIQLNDVDEGYYIIEPNNTKLVIRNNHLDPYVGFSELAAVLVDVTNLKEYRLASLNKVALEVIHSDLSGFDNYYDIIDEVDVKILLFYKIQCMLSNDYEVTDKEVTSCIMYKNKIGSYAPKEKLEIDDDGKPTDNLPKKIYSGSWSL